MLWRTRQPNLEWIQDLEVLEKRSFPLPGATVKRVWTPDPAFKIADAKDSDRLTYYTHELAIRHRKTLMIYVVYRETIDAVFALYQNRQDHPKWQLEQLMALRYFLGRAYNKPKELIDQYGVGGETWHHKWIAEIPEEQDWVFESLAYFLQQNRLIDVNMLQRR